MTLDVIAWVGDLGVKSNAGSRCELENYMVSVEHVCFLPQISLPSLP
jgi:hypothetical protein